jgi:hypothetical protein
MRIRQRHAARQMQQPLAILRRFTFQTQPQARLISILRCSRQRLYAACHASRRRYTPTGACFSSLSAAMTLCSAFAAGGAAVSLQLRGSVFRREADAATLPRCRRRRHASRAMRTAAFRRAKMYAFRFSGFSSAKGCPMRAVVLLVFAISL